MIVVDESTPARLAPHPDQPHLVRAGRHLNEPVGLLLADDVPSNRTPARSEDRREVGQANPASRMRQSGQSERRVPSRRAVRPGLPWLPPRVVRPLSRPPLIGASPVHAHDGSTPSTQQHAPVNHGQQRYTADRLRSWSEPLSWTTTLVPKLNTQACRSGRSTGSVVSSRQLQILVRPTVAHRQFLESASRREQHHPARRARTRLRAEADQRGHAIRRSSDSGRPTSSTSRPAGRRRRWR